MSSRSLIFLSQIFLTSLLLVIPLVPAYGEPDSAKMYLKPVGDTYIYKGCTDCKLFNQSELRVGMDALKVVDPTVLSHLAYKVVLRGPYSALLKFNMSEIPPGAQIKQAKLWLYVMNPPDRSLDLLLYVLRQEFNDSETTWLHRTDKALWKTPGGYAEPDYEVKIRVDESLSEGRSVGFLVTDYVKRVLEGDIEDHGVIIRPRVGKVSPSDFGSSSSMKLYIDFYSKEGAGRAHMSKYTPTLYVEFVKPTAEITLSDSEISLERGQSASITVTESGTFAGSVGLSYRVIEAPGLKVGPLKIEVPDFEREPGFSTAVNITAWKYAPPGKYVIEFYPDTDGYSSKVVEYKRAYLTVYVKGETSTPSATNETGTQTQTQTQQTTASTTSSVVETTESPTQPIQTTTPITEQPPSETSSTLITVTTVIEETGTGAGNTLTIALLASAMVVILVLAVYLLKRRG